MQPEHGVPLPANILPGVYTCLGWDNIDHLEETLSGGGTSHRVNGIAVQPPTYGPFNKCQMPAMQKSKQRSIGLVDEHLPEYIASACQRPKQRNFVEVTSNEVSKSAKMKNLVWFIARLHKATQQTV